MGLIDWARGFFTKQNRKTISAGTVEREFGVRPAASRLMEDNQALWWALYVNHPLWETCDVRPLGLPAAIGRELARHALTEFSVTVSGSPRADFLNQQMQQAVPNFAGCLERGLCLGGIALKPYPENGRLLVDITADFTPTRFDGTGRAVGVVFRSKPVRQNGAWYIRMECHDFQTGNDGTSVYTVENKAFRSSQDGTHKHNLSNH